MSELDWRIENIMHARNLLREVYLKEESASDVDKALRAASLSAEVAWNLIEARNGN